MALTRTDSVLREQILTNELGDRMLNTVAPIYDNSKVALHIFQAIGTVLQKGTDFVAIDLIAQMFPQTATWGLKYWEEEYGLPTDESLSLEERRNNVISSMQFRAPITPKKIADKVASLVGVPTKVIEDTENANIFEVVTSDYVSSSDFARVTEVLDRITPAHLNYYYTTRVELQSLLAVYYNFALSEREFSDVTMAQEETVSHTRVMNEDEYIMVSDYNEIFIY